MYLHVGVTKIVLRFVQNLLCVTFEYYVFIMRPHDSSIFNKVKKQTRS